jgi:hypothetical protein
MISLDRAVDRSDAKQYVVRNGGSGGIHSFMRSQGATGNSKTEIEASWLKAKGGSGQRLNELWGTYLGTKGFTTGGLEERIKSFIQTGTQA